MFHADRVIIGFPCGQGQHLDWLTLGKECCSQVSRRLWGGMKYELPQKRLGGRLLPPPPPQKKINPIKTETYNPEASKFSLLPVKNHAGFFSCPIRSNEMFLPNYEVIWNQNQELKVSLSKK